MRKYTPFLKLKVNEVAAIEALGKELLNSLRPFFDLARKKDLTSESVCKTLADFAKKLKRVMGDQPFFFDTADIPDSIKVNGVELFHRVASELADLRFIPVVGLDRSPGYIQAVLSERKNGLVASDVLALRLLESEFESFSAVEDELGELLVSAVDAGYSEFVLILDCKFCLPASPVVLAKTVTDFLSPAMQTMPFSEAIVVGSSIPVKISDVIATERQVEIPRAELEIFQLLAPIFDASTVGFGDYTIVSPYYSDLDMPAEMLPNVTAPKVVYTYGGVHYVARGGSLRSHHRGHYQYNDIAVDIVGKSFFRKAKYSFGEDFLLEKSQGKGSKVTPGSILKPTICTHVTYMAKDHPLFA